MDTDELGNISRYKIAAVLNTGSGSCIPEHAEEMEEIFKEAGIQPVRIWCGTSDELEGMLSEAKESGTDVLVVLGGDGTIRTAAAQCSQTSAILVPLPGGTMNVLPKALYGDGSWQDILRKILARPRIKHVSGGLVAGQRFFISAICGAPALWANAREALREAKIGEVLAHSKVALKHMFAAKVNYHFDEMNEGTAEALIVTCPLVASTLDDNRQVFEAAVIDVNHAGELLELATAAAFTFWQESKNVAVVRTASVRVTSDHAIPVILDGETIEAGKEIEIEFIPDAFRALVPADEVLP